VYILSAHGGVVVRLEYDLLDTAVEALLDEQPEPAHWSVFPPPADNSSLCSHLVEGRAASHGHVFDPDQARPPKSELSRT
jgi:hypothetical protein